MISDELRHRDDSRCADNARRRRVDELRDWVTRSDQRFLATTPCQITEVNKKNGSSTEDWNDDVCDHVSINGGVEPKRGDCEIDDEDVSASFADDGWRPTGSRRLDANAPISPVLLECGPRRRQIGRSWRPNAVYVAAVG